MQCKYNQVYLDYSKCDENNILTNLQYIIFLVLYFGINYRMVFECGVLKYRIVSKQNCFKN